MKGDDPNLDLNLGNPDAGDSVTLGRFRDVLCRDGAGSMVGIEFRWSPTGQAADSTLFSARYRKGKAGSAELDYLRLGRDEQGFTVQRRKQNVYRLQLADERKSRGQSTDFPYDLNVAMAFGLQPAARTHAIEIAVDVELQ